MKRLSLGALTLLVATLIGNTGAFAQEKRDIHIINDNGVDYIIQKVYLLKHLKAAELYPYIKNALFQTGDVVSIVELSDKPGKQQFLVVTLPPYMVPHVDELIAKLDRPVPKDKQVDGSLIGGDGIYNFAYNPKNRSSRGMMRAVRLLAGSNEGTAFIDGYTNSIYWKDSLSDGSSYFTYLQNMDIPPPQVELAINLYELSDSKLRELGIDWIAWKNGPGGDLFQVAADLTNFQKVSNQAGGLSDLASKFSSSFGGIIFAPQIDASYIRMLAQRGRSRTWTSGYITVLNNIPAEYANDNTFGDAANTPFPYTMSVETDNQYILKNNDQEISVRSNPVRVEMEILQPVISHPDKEKERNLPMILSCQYDLTVSSTVSVEENESGEPVTNGHFVSSNLYMATRTEELLASFSKEWKVEQKQGLPWISELPILEYLTGCVNEARGNSRMFVTCQARELTPQSPVEARDDQTVAEFQDMISQDAH